jgi:hypothetical protein
VGRAGRHPDGEVHHTAAVQGTISGARRGGRTGGASRGDDQNDEERWIIRGKGEDDKEARGSSGSKRNVPNPHGAEGESDGAGAGNKLPDTSKAVDIRKMAEAVFRKTGIRVRIHVLPDRDIQGRDNLRRRKGRRPARSLKKRGWSTGMSSIR